MLDIDCFLFLNYASENELALWSLWLLIEAWLVFEGQVSAVLMGYLWISSTVFLFSAPSRTVTKTSSQSCE